MHRNTAGSIILQVSEAHLQFTIESRELTNATSEQRAARTAPTSITIDAANPDDAISAFVRQSDSELVSFQTPAGRESIATVKKNDTVFLVRVYAE
ncbi:MAG TPA: hypothetical protein VL284_00675 [Thermoanaerobaculia bacterium]|nr:hypothetical protein [Thermoanaerobaculia bacterium]